MGLSSLKSALNAWLRSGNPGTTPGTDFLGTTDDKDMQIKTNSVLRATFKSAGAFQVDAGVLTKDEVSNDVVISSGYTMAHHDLLIAGDILIEDGGELIAL